MELDMVVEIPQGSQNKYEMDHRLGRIRLDRTLFTSTQYPADYGYIPDTLAEDGEPLDAMVPLEKGSFPGCIVRVRPVAVFWMQDERGPDAKVLCMPVGDPRLDHIRDLRNMPEFQLQEMTHFFDIYKRLEPGKSSEVRGWQNRDSAEETVLAAQQRARESAQPESAPAPAQTPPV
ncbi:inorganic diphosphatase [Streptomonospora litoralis]|uniref:Inorganic pyrophosphatase n=1 Tax=Streptomonospora litoralis TaxID=2498135 RepID=A0A4P6PX55_9ACTN|nr:inorganic diphosphatase [Streptomonospora litoralis]QBI52826.1 Inorganic pyrophosphatase [Streptomonospora litoralis]